MAGLIIGFSRGRMDREVFDGGRQSRKLSMDFWSLRVDVVGGAQKVGWKLERPSAIRPMSPP